jgi:DNA-binding transcriptional MerR regulator
MDLLDSYRNQKFKGVAELANAAAQVLGSISLQQSRRLVSDIPNERTIRYYLSEGLLPPADSTEGTASIFGFRHLITLIAIKHLQAREIPIRTIKRILTDLNADGLERLLGEEVRVSFDARDADSARARGEDVVAIADHQEIRDLLSRPRAEFERTRLVRNTPDDMPRQSQASQAYMAPPQSMTTERGVHPDRPQSAAPAFLEPTRATAPTAETHAMDSAGEASRVWERFPVQPGVELQISPDSGLDEPSKRKFMDAVKDLLNHFRHSVF